MIEVVLLARWTTEVFADQSKKINVKPHTQREQITLRSIFHQSLGRIMKKSWY